MTQKIGGPGVGLPLPQNLYPSELANAPYDTPTNRIALNCGDTQLIPAGEWILNMGQYLVLQYLDPVTGVWSIGPNAAWGGGHIFVISDGFNVRIANLTSCPVSASITAYGSGYVQASTTITAVPGNSTWVPIVGGQLASSIVGAGAGYGLPPIFYIPAPPPAANNANGVGGIPASGYGIITNGTLNNSTGFSFTNPGAGYPSAFTVVGLPSPNDPNINSGITLASIVFRVVGSGSITGALCTNNGASIANPNQSTLTVSGAGSQATLVMNCLQTVAASTLSGGGSGFGTLNALLTTVGGVPNAGTVSGSPDLIGIAWRPRPAQIGLAVTAASGSLAAQAPSIYDGGLFLTNVAPTFVISADPLSFTGTVVAPTISLTMGGRADIATLQPAP